MERARRKIPLWLRISLGLMAAVFVVVAAAVALRFWITSDGGRAFITSQIDGRRLGPLGAVRISGLKGDPLGAATVADLALVDDEGVWLRARDARIEWTPTALFAGELEIQKINFRTVDVLRPPVVAEQEDGGPPPDIGLRLDEVSVDDLHLAEPVIGLEARYAIRGGAASQRDGDGFARLVLSPVSGPADKADLSVGWSPTGDLTGAASVSGPADGLIARLLQAPGGAAVAFNGQVNGTLDRFAGSGTLFFADRAIAKIGIERRPSSATLNATVDADSWPLLGAISERAGGTLTIAGAADLARLDASILNLHITGASGAISAAARMNFETWEMPRAFGVRAKGLDLARLAPPLGGRLDAAGQLRLVGLADLRFAGEADIAGFAWPSGRSARVTGPIVVEKNGAMVGWRTSGATLDGASLDALPRLAPARYLAATRGEFNSRTGVIEVYQAQVQGSPGSLSARGTYATRGGAFDLRGAARLVDMSGLAPLAGSAQGEWTATSASANAPIRISLDAQGRSIAAGNPALSDLIGSEPTLRLSGIVRNGRFTLESGTLAAAGLRASMKGRILDTGEISGTAAGSLTRPLDLPGAAFTGAAFTATVSGDAAAPLVDIRLSNAAVAVAGLPLDGLSGRASLRFGETIAGEFALNGSSSGQAFTARGDILAGEGDWRISNVSASLGDLRLTAPRLVWAEDALAADFAASGSLANIGGIQRGALTLSGRASLGETLSADISGRVTDLRSGDLRVDLVSFRLIGSRSLRLEAAARGRYGSPFELAINGDAARVGDGWQGAVMLDGKVDGLPVRTARAAAWRLGPDQFSVDGELDLFEGRLVASLSQQPDAARARLDLSGVKLRALSSLARLPALEGVVSGRASFANVAGAAEGQLSLAIANANPVGVTSDPVTIGIESTLRNRTLTTTSTGAGQGFELTAESRVPVRVGQGFDIAVNPDAPLASRFDLKGRAEQLWALLGPVDQSLRGRLEASLTSTGSLNDPVLTGAARITDGAYEHGETGLALRDISADISFDQRAMTVRNVLARDANGGRVSASGRFTWANGVEGGLDFRAENIRALGRDDRFAIVSGDGVLALDGNISIRGAMTVREARISVEQPAAASIPTIPGLRRINFPNQPQSGIEPEAEMAPWLRPVKLDLKVSAPRRVVVFGRGLDTEWSLDAHVTGPIADPEVEGTATLVRGQLDLAGKRFQFDTGTITLDGPIRAARIEIAAARRTQDILARVQVSGTPQEPEFKLESTPSLPQDEILARVLFGRSAAELSGFEAAQLAAGLAQLAGGQAGFDPIGLVRQATGLDRISVGAEGGVATVSAGKYISENVYLQVGAGGEGSIGAEVEWEPQKELSIISSAEGNGDTKIAIRWKKDY